MKRIILTAVAASLLAAGAANAQTWQGGDRRGPQPAPGIAVGEPRPDGRWDRDDDRYDRGGYERDRSDRGRGGWDRDDRGWSDRRDYGRLRVGQVLPRDYWSPRHQVNDFRRYDLPRPGRQAAWVRVGRDAVLVDYRTRRVIDVEARVFR